MLQESDIKNLRVDYQKYQKTITYLNTIVDDLNQKLAKNEKVMSVWEIPKSEKVPENENVGASTNDAIGSDSAVAVWKVAVAMAAGVFIGIL